MIKLIDPKRQEELEDTIVNLQVQVTQLVGEVHRLREASIRNQRDIQKINRELQESYTPKTNPWEARVTYVDPVGRSSMTISEYDEWIDNKREISTIAPTRDLRSLDSWMTMMAAPVSSVSRFEEVTGTSHHVVVDDDF